VSLHARRPSRRLLGVLLVLAVLSAGAVTLLLPHRNVYDVQLAHASGLRPGDEVRVAGIAVGKVRSVRLAGTFAVASIETDRSVHLTEDTRAAVKLSSLLGQRYLEVRPGDGRPLEGPIPLANTEPAYTLDHVFVAGQDELEGLDLRAIGKAIDVLGTDLAGPSKEAGAALAGVTSLSRMVSSRDEQLTRLLGATRDVTEIVRGQQGDLMTLAKDSDLVFAMVYQRREVIRRLLADTRVLVAEVSRLVERNERHLRPMLLEMRGLLTVLLDNKKELEQTLALTAPMMRYYANASGDGPWVNVYAPYFLLPDNVTCPLLTPKDCG
jgi:phospholipid/cholesterol/gamma-HCH transport system substrate-binding protein